MTRCRHIHCRKHKLVKQTCLRKKRCTQQDCMIHSASCHSMIRCQQIHGHKRKLGQQSCLRKERCKQLKCRSTGGVATHDMAPAYPLLQSRAGPVTLFGTGLLHATGLQFPMGELPLQEMSPIYPSLRTQAGQSTMSEKATLQATGLQDPLGKLYLHDTELVSPVVQVPIVIHRTRVSAKPSALHCDITSSLKHRSAPSHARIGHSRTLAKECKVQQDNGHQREAAVHNQCRQTEATRGCQQRWRTIGSAMGSKDVQGKSAMTLTSKYLIRIVTTSCLK